MCTATRFNKSVFSNAQELEEGLSVRLLKAKKLVDRKNGAYKKQQNINEEQLSFMYGH